jgi:hypothetical protein
MPRSSKWSLSLTAPQQNTVCPSHVWDVGIHKIIYTSFIRHGALS